MTSAVITVIVPIPHGSAPNVAATIGAALIGCWSGQATTAEERELRRNVVYTTEIEHA